MPKLIPIIGLEIHVELKTKSKMFCSCANNPFIAKPNVNVCEVCLAHPGTLPVPNKEAIIWTVKIAQALNCKINKHSKFDRKHYFYPDLPKGYQISQYDEPIGIQGFLELTNLGKTNQRDTAKIGITRVHLEEDTAKLTHGGAAVSHPESATADEGFPILPKTKQTDYSLVDFNRAGVPLVEIVSEPDIASAVEAKAYCQELQMILRYLGASDADMEKGFMRCEANISMQEEGRFVIEKGALKPIGDYKLNGKVELKNINSFKAIEKGIDFEIARQTKLITQGLTEFKETMGWDESKGETVHQRSKESAADYRYFPEPDIPPFEPLKIAGDISLPELPASRRQRFSAEFGFSLADAYLLTTDKTWSIYAEEVMTELNDWLHSLPETHDCVDKDKNTDRPPICKTAKELTRLAGGWLTSKLMGAMNERKLEIKDLKIKPENFAELIALIYAERINSTNAQKILSLMLESGVDQDPTHIMEEKGFGQITDENKIGIAVDEVIKNNPAQVAQFKAGKEPLIKFLIGMVMKSTEGSANPQVAEKMLREKLKI